MYNSEDKPLFSHGNQKIAKSSPDCQQKEVVFFVTIDEKLQQLRDELKAHPERRDSIIAAAKVLEIGKKFPIYKEHYHKEKPWTPPTLANMVREALK